MKNKSKNSKNKFLEVFDVLFIMILCFATLFTALIIQGKASESSSSGMDYTFHGITFLITILGLVIYVVYMINQSDKQLKDMINKVYSNKIDNSRADVIENEDEFATEKIS
ncbi:hypothetical protein [Clostridium sp.]|uniref:hypothetical protein n=1 Tax=Clostridium sp. TaxID=1506 RepID=UPI001A52EC1C|nr:hypothetical protein [Clostridium sp.]MBK5241395.1 hypothetical protein [Clostridium sp.]